MKMLKVLKMYITMKFTRERTTITLFNKTALVFFFFFFTWLFFSSHRMIDTFWGYILYNIKSTILLMHIKTYFKYWELAVTCLLICRRCTFLSENLSIIYFLYFPAFRGTVKLENTLKKFVRAPVLTLVTWLWILYINVVAI